MSDHIWMEHPDLGPERRQQTTPKQLEDVWAKSGWVESDPPEAAEEDSQNLESIDYPLNESDTEEE